MTFVMVNVWKDLSAGKKVPEEFTAVIETPMGSRNKYELEKESGAIMLDRVLYSPFHYPFDYGFIPQSYWDDGDPLDVALIVHDATIPGCIVNARPIGVMYMIDSGDNDEKIIAVPVNDPRFSHFKDIDDVGEHFKKEVAHFFEHYKDLQGKKVEVKKWGNKAEAMKLITRGLKLYQDKFNK